MSNCLIIFVKNAQLGKVKTRLAKTMGDEEALRIYQVLLNHTHEITIPLEFSKQVYYSEHLEDEDIWGKEFECFVQDGGDLGHRMSNAFQEAFNTHDRICIIGSDCAALHTELIQDAYEHLDLQDVVLGPAIDGGYYLLGMKNYHPEIFENINWSTSTVLAETIARIKKLGLSYSRLPELSDIDTQEDWDNHK